MENEEVQTTEVPTDVVVEATEAPAEEVAVEAPETPEAPVEEVAEPAAE